jgi:hypothetical protein
MEDSKVTATPMSTTTTLDADEEGVTRGPEGVPGHDRVTPLLDGYEARYPILGMCVHSFSSVSKDFAPASSQVHINVFATHSRLWPLVLRVFFFGSSWIFGRGFCWVSVG